MSMAKLKKYIKKNGKAKTAVALGLKETNAINNWLARNDIPEKFKGDVRALDKVEVHRYMLQEEIKNQQSKV